MLRGGVLALRQRSPALRAAHGASRPGRHRAAPARERIVVQARMSQPSTRKGGRLPNKREAADLLDVNARAGCLPNKRERERERRGAHLFDVRERRVGAVQPQGVPQVRHALPLVAQDLRGGRAGERLTAAQGRASSWGGPGHACRARGAAPCKGRTPSLPRAQLSGPHTRRPARRCPGTGPHPHPPHPTCTKLPRLATSSTLTVTPQLGAVVSVRVVRFITAPTSYPSAMSPPRMRTLTCAQGGSLWGDV